MKREGSKSFDKKDVAVLLGLALVIACLALVKPELLIGLAGLILIAAGTR